MKIEIYDTTLRDGAQAAGISFTDEDRLKIIHALDSLGVPYIEAGYFTKASVCRALFDKKTAPKLANAKLVAFLPTCRPETTPDGDALLSEVAASAAEAVAVVGKACLFQVRSVLCTTAEENIRIISDTIKYFKSHGKEVIFDAEHFFDGYSEEPTYALTVVGAAAEAGADTVVLCDTNGGMLPDVVGMTCASVRGHFPALKFGIHCHNDMGMAAACTTAAVLAGASQFQGTVLGIGERCGNADITTVVPVLQLKLGFSCIAEDALSRLCRFSREICEIMNVTFNEHAPFVGGYAFSHKGGLHIDAVNKTPDSFEHIKPEAVGNKRDFLISELSGRAALLEKMLPLSPSLTKDSPQVASALAKVREYESRGFQYEGAEGSLALLIYEALGLRRSFFELRTFNVNIGEPRSISPDSKCSALIKVSVDGRESLAAAEGDGPVNALDLALRGALAKFYPEIDGIRLTDYKVRVLDSDMATASVVRVVIESSDGAGVWRTTGVSHDIIDASWQALRDAVEYRLMQSQIKSGEVNK